MNITPTGAICANPGASALNFPVVLACPLSKPLYSFYRWLWRWHQDTGDVSPSTDYLARKQKRDARTIYRRLRELAALGLIEKDVEEGISRRIVPLVDPARIVFAPGKRQGSASGVNRQKRQGPRQGSSPIKTQETHIEMQQTQTPTQTPVAPDPAVALLEKDGGVTRTEAVSIAADARTYRRTMQEIRRIVARFRRCKEVNTPGAYLRQAVRNGWWLDEDEGGEASERRREIDRPRHYVTAPRDEARECPHKPSDCPHSAPGASGGTAAVAETAEEAKARIRRTLKGARG